MQDAKTNKGITIYEYSHDSRVMLVFLRHFGCTFCREMLSDISKLKNTIEQKGVMIVLVHMVGEDEAKKVLSEYRLEDLPRISNPEMDLYSAWGLEQGSVSQLFGMKVWWRGLTAGVIKGHGIGWLKGNGFQMPGIFLLENEMIIDQFIHDSAADRPNYWEMACCE
ncbi:redoxin domain-containing protein [Hyphobacterium sp. CCMP332]|nr:redoxin domain-containing protein [Hyphobacterium sp. CCMP332]